jgi:hypothetical protein
MINSKFLALASIAALVIHGYGARADGYWAEPRGSIQPPPVEAEPQAPPPPAVEAPPPAIEEPAIVRPPPVIRQRRVIRHAPYPLPPRRLPFIEEDWGPPPPIGPIFFGFRRWRYPPPYWGGYPYGWRGWRHEHHGWRGSRFHHR